MSRSYKKTPIVKDSGSKKWSKRQAAKAIRLYKGTISNGGSYKKFYEQWNINDFLSYEPWNVKTMIEYDYCKKEWAKYYYRK